jgi:hypothetical protein
MTVLLISVSAQFWKLQKQHEATSTHAMAITAEHTIATKVETTAAVTTTASDAPAMATPHSATPTRTAPDVITTGAFVGNSGHELATAGDDPAAAIAGPGQQSYHKGVWGQEETLALTLLRNADLTRPIDSKFAKELFEETGQSAHCTCIIVLFSLHICMHLLSIGLRRNLDQINSKLYRINVAQQEEERATILDKLLRSPTRQSK